MESLPLSIAFGFNHFLPKLSRILFDFIFFIAHILNDKSGTRTEEEKRVIKSLPFLHSDILIVELLRSNMILFKKINKELLLLLGETSHDLVG